MMKPLLPTLAAVLVAGVHTYSEDRPANHDQRAVAAIRALGGNVTMDSSKPEAPVAVVLTGSDDPNGCLPHLKHIRNLRTCDL